MNTIRCAVQHRCAGFATLLAVVLAGCAASTQKDAQSPGAKTAERAAQLPADKVATEVIPLEVQIFFRPLPAAMPGSQNDTPEMIALGRKLYFERAISLNNTQSCNDCHRLDQQLAGVDNEPTSKGVKGLPGARNSPTVVNAGFQLAQFWDGRAPDLVEQAKGPVLNPVEMAMPTEADVVNRLKGLEGYDRAFAVAFPGQADPITFDNTARAIAAFERTLIEPARFDRYLKGDPGALTDEEKSGLHMFTHTGCTECHSSYTVGGRLFEKVGVFHPFPNLQDEGRSGVTHQEEDRYVFKAPMLRNVTLTAPYFHDGSVSELSEAVRLMAWIQLDTELSPSEIDEIICFLYTLESEHPIDISSP